MSATTHPAIAIRRAAALSVALAAIAPPALAVEWFPRQPGTGDTVYLLHTDPCGTGAVVGTPVLRFDAATGVAALEFDTAAAASDAASCAPGQAPSADAFAIPAAIDGTPIRRLVVDIDEGSNRAQTIRLTPPQRLGIPPSIVGTWNAAGHVRQGFLITMTQRGELAVSWNTYDAEGNKAWYSGVAATNAASSEVSMALVDTSGGFFGEQAQLIPALKQFATVTLDYLGCGQMHMAWTPAAYTTHAAGEDIFTQLTAPQGDACNLQAWAEARGVALRIVEPDLVL